MRRGGMAGKGVYTQDKATGFESRTQTQQEALELHFAQNQYLMGLGRYNGTHTDAIEAGTKMHKRRG